MSSADATLRIRPLPALPPDLSGLVEASEAEGLEFLRKVHEGRGNGTAYEHAGETVFEARVAGRLIGVCGMTRDPYTAAPRTGRVRHVYVHPEWRRRGVAGAMLRALLAAAPEHFDVVRLRALDARAASVYERAGFTPTDEPDATHRAPPGTRA